MTMTDYLDEYGDEVESIENCLSHALELVAEAKDYLRRGLALKASYAVFEAKSRTRSADSGLYGLYRSLEHEAKQ